MCCAMDLQLLTAVATLSVDGGWPPEGCCASMHASCIGCGTHLVVLAACSAAAVPVNLANGSDGVSLPCCPPVCQVYAIAFNNPYGDKVATGSFDKTARLWDVKSGDCCHQLRGTHNHTEIDGGPDSSAMAADISPEGRVALAACTTFSHHRIAIVCRLDQVMRWRLCASILTHSQHCWPPAPWTTQQRSACTISTTAMFAIDSSVCLAPQPVLILQLPPSTHDAYTEHCMQNQIRRQHAVAVLCVGAAMGCGEGD